MKKEIKPEILELENFKVIFFNSNPPRMEAKIEFDKNHFSQKLIFTLMDIAFSFGVGCSKPFFGEKEEDAMFFLLRIFVNSKRNMKAQKERMNACLLEILDFSKEFAAQMDFSKIDLSMFDGSVEGDVEKLSLIRDQIYKGSWDEFYNVMEREGYEDAAKMVIMLKKFEEKNQKNVGFVGHKLNYLLASIYNENQNTVLN